MKMVPQVLSDVLIKYWPGPQSGWVPGSQETSLVLNYCSDPKYSNTAKWTEVHLLQETSQVNLGPLVSHNAFHLSQQAVSNRSRLASTAVVLWLTMLHSLEWSPSWYPEIFFSSCFASIFPLHSWQWNWHDERVQDTLTHTLSLWSKTEHWKTGRHHPITNQPLIKKLVL